MRRLSTISAFAAGVLAILAGVYMSSTIHIRKSEAATAFSPNSLVGDQDMKSESYSAF